MNFWESIKLILLIQTIVGLSPFSYKTVEKNGKVSLRSKIYSILFFCTFIILFTFGLLFIETQIYKDFIVAGYLTTYVAQIITFFNVMIANVMFIVIQLTAQFNIDDHMLFLNKINEIDSILKIHFKFTINYRKYYLINIFAIFAMVTVFILMALDFTSIFLTIGNDIIMPAICLTVIILFFCRLVALFIYVNYICLIYLRYKFLMAIIKNILKNISKLSLRLPLPPSTSTADKIIANNHQIFMCCYLFRDLHKTICIFNKVFGRIILLLMFHSFTMCLSELFLLVIHLQTTQHINKPFVRYTTVFILHELMKMVLSTFSTQFTIDKVRNSNYTIL